MDIDSINFYGEVEKLVYSDGQVYIKVRTKVKPSKSNREGIRRLKIPISEGFYEKYARDFERIRSENTGLRISLYGNLEIKLESK